MNTINSQQSNRTFSSKFKSMVHTRRETWNGAFVRLVLRTRTAYHTVPLPHKYCLSNFDLSRLILACLLSHNTIHSASRTLFTRLVEQPHGGRSPSAAWLMRHGGPCVCALRMGGAPWQSTAAPPCRSPRRWGTE